MLLAVAGLKEKDIKERTKKLSADWSAFPVAEQMAFRFAYQVTKEPAAVQSKEIQQLVQAYGRPRALDLVWYAGWCNYMTRVADAFQLPLEKENVFVRPEKKPEANPPVQGKK